MEEFITRVQALHYKRSEVFTALTRAQVAAVIVKRHQEAVDKTTEMLKGLQP